MIVGEARLRFLQRGLRQRVELPFEYRPDGSLRKGPIVGAIVSAQAAPFQKGKHCTVVDVQHTATGWLVELAAGDVRDQARLLARRKGSVESDGETHGYVIIDTGDPSEDELRKAMVDEPEVLDEGFERVVARHGRMEQVQQRTRREALAKLRSTIAELESEMPEERGRIQRLKAQAKRLDAAA